MAIEDSGSPTETATLGSGMLPAMRGWMTLVLVLSATTPVRAVNELRILDVRADPPTLLSIGIQVLISDDDDYDARIETRYRAVGDTDWRTGPPLFRVRPETVTAHVLPEQFRGSILDLRPATTWEVELHFIDSDGPVDAVQTLTVTTRPVPVAEPATPRLVVVRNPAELRAAFGSAMPGDIIELTDGTYTGDSYTLNASGTADNPIVIRGQSLDGVILDGDGCLGCNIIEIYGSFIHIERMTLQNAVRAIRFQGAGTEHNVVRRVHIRDVDHGIGSAPDQSNFYLCDNEVHGRLRWPLVYSDDGGLFADLQGVRVDGDGHVVCHNAVSGFGDPLLNFAEGYVSGDFYGNDVFDIYGDGIELDRAKGNVRLFRSRFTNVFTAVSMQPIYGGPAYVFENVVSNVADEQIKLKSTGGINEPSGALIFHNTFVSPAVALNLQAPITQHNFQVINNIFFGPDVTTRGFTVDWTPAINLGSFNFNAYYPDGRFWFGRRMDGSTRLWMNFAAAKASGEVEADGMLLMATPFATGLVPPASYTTAINPPDASLAAGMPPVDSGAQLPGLNDDFRGAAPDLGALERGCAVPWYGVRPLGSDEDDHHRPCEIEPSSDGGGPFVDGGDASDPGWASNRSISSGCGCQQSVLPGVWMLVVGAVLRRWAKR